MRQSEKERQLGLNIAFYRKRKGLSQGSLAELVSIRRTHRSRLETADCAVSLDVEFDLCEARDGKPSQRFGFREQRQSPAAFFGFARRTPPGKFAIWPRFPLVIICGKRYTFHGPTCVRGRRVRPARGDGFSETGGVT